MQVCKKNPFSWRIPGQNPQATLKKAHDNLSDKNLSNPQNDEVWKQLQITSSLCNVHASFSFAWSISAQKISKRIIFQAQEKIFTAICVSREFMATVCDPRRRSGELLWPQFWYQLLRESDDITWSKAIQTWLYAQEFNAARSKPTSTGKSRRSLLYFAREQPITMYRTSLIAPESYFLLTIFLVH